MNYGEIKKNDIANGEGVRTSLFVSGCIAKIALISRLGIFHSASLLPKKQWRKYSTPARLIG